MNRRFLLSVCSLFALVHCGGATTSGAPGDGTDGGTGSSSGASSSGASSGSSGSGSGGSSGSSGSGSSSGSSSGAVDSGSDACVGRRTFDGGSRGTPAEHRAVATACAVSVNHCVVGDAAAPLSCTTDADCRVDAATGLQLATTCLHGSCSVDSCLADSDCAANEVCACSATSGFSGGLACNNPNRCIPANCRVDADCGVGGFCSPSAGSCGSIEGYYCHKPTDPCFDPATDCGCEGPAGGACTYSPQVGSFVCAEQTVCAG